MEQLTLTTAPAAEPVSAAEAKLHLRVDISTDDDLITSLITAARMEVEQWTGRALINQTWDWKSDAFPCGDWLAFRAPLPPLSSVTHVKYIDSAGTEQTVSTDDYTTHVFAGPFAARGLILPKYGKIWPSPRAEAGAVRVRFVAGYGAAGSAVPAPLLAAIKLLIGDLYENREAQIEARAALLENKTLQRILFPFKASAL